MSVALDGITKNFFIVKDPYLYSPREVEQNINYGFGEPCLWLKIRATFLTVNQKCWWILLNTAHTKKSEYLKAIFLRNQEKSVCLLQKYKTPRLFSFSILWKMTISISIKSQFYPFQISNNWCFQLYALQSLGWSRYAHNLLADMLKMGKGRKTAVQLMSTV